MGLILSFGLVIPFFQNKIHKMIKLTIHEFDLVLQPQNVQESSSQKAQHSQKDNGYTHMAWIHSQTSSQKPEKTKS